MRRYLFFVVAGLALLMASIDGTVVAVALPVMTQDLNTTLIWTGWTLGAYQLVVTVVMPLAGKMSDEFGRKSVFLVSVVLFTVSSFLCGIAPNIYFLIAFRALQAIGGGSFLPSAAGLVNDHFPESRERAIGLFTSIFPIGGIIGPNLGGWIVQHYSWLYVFYINVPVGIVLLILSFLLIKGSSAKAIQKIDYTGVGLFAGAILSLMFALTQLGENLTPLSEATAVCLFLLSGVFLAAFIYWERKTENPIMDMALMWRKPFLAANLYNLLFGACVFGLLSFVPLYAVQVYGLSTLQSGVILTPRSVAIIVASAVTSFMLKRFGYRLPMILGIVLIALGLFTLGREFQSVGAWGAEDLLFAVMALCGLGIGIALPASNNACIELMPDKVATITGLRGMFRSAGGVIGISTSTLVLHLYGNAAPGFKVIFTVFGGILLLIIPLVFLMPSGSRLAALASPKRT